jgi:hypothetical protein
LSRLDLYLPRFASLLAVAVALAVSPSQALIIKTWNGAGTPALINTTAPADDPGFHNLPNATANGLNKKGIYLGDNLFLTVVHDDAAVNTIQIGNGVFPVIPGSAVTLTNPTSFGGSRVNSDGSLTVNSDLRLYRIGVDGTTGLTPEELDPAIRSISLATRLPNTSTEQLTMVGKGLIRTVNTANTSTGQFHYNSGGAVLTNPADWPTSAYRGFGFGDSATQPRPWQWGTNVRTTASPNGIVKVGQNVLMEGGFLDTIGFVVRFDEAGLADEAQGAAGDSGGPVFWKDGDEWVLAGLMHGVYFGNGQPSVLGMFGSFTGISDLSHPTYRNQIEFQRRTMGDVNLDGIVSGSIANGVATGDLAAMVSNWNSVSTASGYETWMKGDLNLDGRVDLADFVMLRDALGGSISSSSFAQLVAAATIPEPSTLGLAVVAGLASIRRRRR